MSPQFKILNHSWFNQLKLYWDNRGNSNDKYVTTIIPRFCYQWQIKRSRSRPIVTSSTSHTHTHTHAHIHVPTGCSPPPHWPKQRNNIYTTHIKIWGYLEPPFCTPADHYSQRLLHERRDSLFPLVIIIAYLLNYHKKIVMGNERCGRRTLKNAENYC